MRPRRQVIESGDGVPLHLLAGARIEVWSPEVGDWKEAWRRYRRARSDWNTPHPGRPLVSVDAGAVPWSYVFIGETRGAESLAARLSSRGLPEGWQPTPI